MSIMNMDQSYVAGTYKRFPVEIVSGKGSKVVDVNGKTYIDMGSGIGVTAFGIADEAWQAAVTGQIGKVQHMSNLYYTEPCALLAKLLCEKTGMKKVFFANSGAEANEGAIKVARKYAAEKHGADHYTIITLNNSFHGRTLTTLAATGQEHFHKLFQPLTPGFVSTPANDFEALKELAIQTKAAGIMMECIQGEGGVLPLTSDFVKAVAAFCQEQDIVLIIDEVQTGNGRTGTLYAYQQFGIMPDVVSTAKGLAGGLPMGATMLSKKVEGVLTPGSHGSTFGGNPVCAAGAISIIERIDDELLSSVCRKEQLIREKLSACKNVKEITGRGLMLGIECEAAGRDVANAALEKGVLVLTAKNKVHLVPPLNISDADLCAALEILADIIDS